MGVGGLGRSPEHYRIQSISGRYASYLNAFLFLLFSESNDPLSQKAAHVIFYEQTLVFFHKKNIALIDSATQEEGNVLFILRASSLYNKCKSIQ